MNWIFISKKLTCLYIRILWGNQISLFETILLMLIQMNPFRRIILFSYNLNECSNKIRCLIFLGKFYPYKLYHLVLKMIIEIKKIFIKFRTYLIKLTESLKPTNHINFIASHINQNVLLFVTIMLPLNKFLEVVETKTYKACITSFVKLIKL